jgi:hypothetical protein
MKILSRRIFAAIFPFFSSNSRAIRLKLGKNLPQFNFLSLQSLFSDKLLGIINLSNIQMMLNLAAFGSEHLI